MAKIIYSVLVKQKHISEGIARNERQCAVAKAIVESDPANIIRAKVNRRFTEITRRDTQHVECYYSPAEVIDAVDVFDDPNRQDGDLSPFRFKITDDLFVSERPRQIQQAAKAVEAQKRRTIAKATGKKVTEITKKEIKQYTEDSKWQDTSTPRARVVRPKKARAPKVETPRLKMPRKVYLKRDPFFGGHE